MKAKLREKMIHGTLQFPVNVYETTIQSGSPLPLYVHWHEEAEFLYICQGSMNLQIEDENVYLQQGDCVFIRPDVLHGSCRKTTECLRYRAVLFHTRFLESQDMDVVMHKYLLPFFSKEQGNFIVLRKHETVTGKLDAIRELYRNRSWGAELLIRAGLLEFIAMIPEPERQDYGKMNQDRYGESMRRALVYMEESYDDRIKLPDIAAQAAMSTEHFCRKFRAAFGMTAMEYLTRIRLREGERLLMNTDDTIEAIAQHTGFAGANYFTVCFKKYYQCTPSAYRRKYMIE